MFASMLTVLAMCNVNTAHAEKDYWNDETPKERDARMEWWNNARFGMFIHWGLYSIPAGEWKGRTNHAEWIRTTAHIPVETYDKFVGEFNPTNFNADAWAKMAKRAGMKYMVITTKHHDGFCLWPSKVSEYDIESTPYKKDILKELTKACKKENVRMCFYHSIMDWHNPDYLPRRKWERKNRPDGDADFERYVTYLKAQLAELVNNYDPGVLWFDGEWEGTWNHERGKDLYQYLRSMDHNLIINNRIDKGRRGMHGMTKEGEFRGDFGTPEQQIPDTGIPGVYWESCMTMNKHWGWNKNDHNWKSGRDLVRKLADIASKGGNFLLNIGPKPDGTFPQKAIERIDYIGKWMDVNSEAIYGTQASPFGAFKWGRCTMKKMKMDTTRLYLHVFNRPQNGTITLPLGNSVKKCFMLAEPKNELTFTKTDFKISIELPEKMPDADDSVIVIDIKGDPNIVTLDPYANETKAEREARMKWWREARFGMFIHWGVYAVPAGTYKGKKIRGIGEWIMNRGKIPVADYKDFAKDFNPIKYDADEWVKMAKNAGMKYIVITAKHHDGFALFKTDASKWNIVDATPYGKDLLRPLEAACKKYDMKLGFYYSQAQDWTNPGGAKAGYKEPNGWDPAQKGDFDKYLKNIAYRQVEELLTGYDINVLWWDTPVWMNKKRAEILLPLLHKKPGLITNNRLGGGYRGDTDTPEQHIPATGMPGRDWETCMTMNNTWGYKSYDNNWKSTETLIRNLVDIASKGGNYLLNIGPKPDGTFPDTSIKRLKEVGQWMKVNGKAIYATQASPCARPRWGRITTKPLESGDTRLYLHIFDWPENGKIKVPLSNSVKSCHLLADNSRSFTTTSGEEGTTINLSGNAPDKICSVIVLEIKGQPQITIDVTKQNRNGEVTLKAIDALIHNRGYGKHTKYEKAGNIGHWNDPRSWVEWTFKIDKPGTFGVNLEVADPIGKTPFTIKIGKQQLQATTDKTNSYKNYTTINTGTLKIEKAGIYRLAVKPTSKGWHPINLRTITLSPTP